MNVEWEKTTLHEFEEHKKSGVCVLPLEWTGCPTPGPVPAGRR